MQKVQKITVRLPIGTLDAIGSLPEQPFQTLHIREVFSEFPWVPVVARATVETAAEGIRTDLRIRELQACKGSEAKEALLRWIIREAYECGSFRHLVVSPGVIGKELLRKYRFQRREDEWLHLNLHNSVEMVRLITDLWR